MNNLNHSKSWISRIHSWISNIGTWTVALISIMGLFLPAPIYGISLLVKSISGLLDSFEMGDISLWTAFIFSVRIGISVYCFVVEWRVIRSCFTKHRVCEDGIEACFPHRASEKYGWSDFQEVCICYEGSHAKTNVKHLKLICFIRNGEKKNIFGFWKIDAFWRYPRIIRMNYTPEIFEEIANNCPIRIVDYCK